MGRILPAGSSVSTVLATLTRADRSRAESDSFASTSTNTTLVPRGTIQTIRDNFGFIGHPKYPQGIFFHFGSLPQGFIRESLSIGQQVEFELQLQEDGRYRGVKLSPLSSM